ncbi:glutamate synthase (NADPH/NADH) small chain [Sporobacter termitidis DSM 10068]|uniref:Glutamate synthase (NADPH/NADH) small chain n=1 Tax=Sporobacter termitidis DSM 10068 TaxID=1123282 RepID=A0A1M5Z6N5_9FIRM|nr:glutamate synthase subunit beta [Sporobacter termitidis]SHI19916.1 glutamate synthase (NADPH/NADH) small chain [Sporobacter termitidis DSM 10068]
MAKPTGFLEQVRENAPDRPVRERIRDWNDFHTTLPLEQLKAQSARCMDCGTAFCQMGLMLNGTASGCPLNNLIPEWNELLYKGMYEQAYKRLIKTSSFPEFTSRVCPALCEGSCTLGLNDAAVTTKQSERAIIEHAYESGLVKPRPPKTRTGKKVAVVGSGPSGLACADALNKLGNSVTVFEKDDRVGGLLMYGIPNMKLEKQLIDRRVKLMQAEGVVFKTGVEIGRDIPAESLKKDFDAVVLCIGAKKPRDLAVAGRDCKGVCFAVDFLAANTKSLLDSGLADGNFVSAKDKDVIVIGGGDTGTDCVATAIRHGCKSVNQFEIMPAAPADRSEKNPWPEWPKTLKTDYGQEEAIELFGRDPRNFCLTTKKIECDESGNVKALHTVEVDWTGGGMKEVTGTEKVWPAQLVLIAMGFLGPDDKIIKDLSLGQDKRSNIDAKEGDYATNVEGVFAAGDARRGQSLVVWAIKEGRDAAAACHKYLTGK